MKAIVKRALSWAFCFALVLGFAGGNGIKVKAEDSHMNIFMLDAGRKYFSVAEIEDVIDEMADDGYGYLELAVGNDALRFVLDDMSVDGYDSDSVKNAVLAGNRQYYDDPNGNALSESEMDSILSYASSKGIEVIPLLNTPGHMDAILSAMSSLGISTPSYNGSVRTLDIRKSDAVNFVQALVGKYVSYFAGKNCHFFNMGCDEFANDIYSNGGMGFAYIQRAGNYDEYINYVNGVAGIIEKAGMTPMAFNDGIYYNNQTRYGTFDNHIMVCYWTSGWSGYSVASASYLAGKGFDIINTNDAWYYVLGRNSGTYGYSGTLNGLRNKHYTDVSGSNNINVRGAQVSVWADSPSAVYDADQIKTILSTFAQNNSSFFAKPVHVHTWDDGVVTVAPTCTDKGVKTYTCTGCGETRTEEIDALGHEFGAWVNDGDTHSRTCLRCGEKETEVHSFDQGTIVKEATESETGLKVYTCSVCGAQKEEVIPAVGNADVVSLRNISGATEAGRIPALPDTVQGIDREGNVIGNYPVVWNNANADRFNQSGSVVVNGSAEVNGKSLPVTDTIRVVEKKSDTSNVAGEAALSEDARYPSDQLNSIVNGKTAFSYSTNERWTNYNNRNVSRNASITLKWDASKKITAVNLYFFTDGYSAALPADVKFAYSSDGNTFADVNYQKVQPYSGFKKTVYAFDQDVDAKALRITLTEQNGHCVGLTEAEVIVNAESTPALNSSAALSAIYIDNEKLSDFDGSKDSYIADGEKVTGAESISNVGITALPQENNVAKILTISEDGSNTRTYTVTLSGVKICHHKNTEVRNKKDATCTEAGYSGDVYCLDCGELLSKGEVIAALGHDYETTVVAPTYTSTGYTLHTCRRCGDSYKTDETPMLTRTTGNWQSTWRGWRYRYSDGTYAANGWKEINGSWYYFDSNGYYSPWGNRGWGWNW